MEQKLKDILKTLKLNETTISTIMGGVVILIVAVLMFNYFKSINQQEIETTEPAKMVEVKEGEKPSNLPVTYKVEKGDHLWSIAEKFYRSGYNYVDIAIANNLSNANYVEVGQQLNIPQVEVRKITVETTEKITETTIESDTYITMPGDYLWEIALRAYGDGFAWTRIYEANKEVIGANPNLIEKEVTLVIPR